MKTDSTFSNNILLIVIVSSLLGFAYNTFSSSGISLIRTEKTFEYESDENLSAAETMKGNSIEPKLISIEQGYKLFSSGDAIFIDARDKWDFADGHIIGALNIPEYNFDPNSNRVTGLSLEETYVIYCSDDDCETSKRLALELSKLGFNNLYIFESGWNEWIKSNFPTETGEIE